MKESMNEGAYHFVNHWRVRGAIDLVYDILRDGPRYAEWWPAYRISEDVGPSKTRVATQARFPPYALEFTAEIVREKRPSEIDIVASGHLSGSGKWRLEAAGPLETDIVFYWDVDANRKVMVALAPILRPLFDWNHDWVMSQGERALQWELDRRLPASQRSPFQDLAGDYRVSATWTDVAYMHWPVATAVLRELVPRQLDLDLFEGQAWISLVALRISDMRYPFAPRWLSFPRLRELNLRTYVKHRGVGGVCFLGIDISSAMMARVFRRVSRYPCQVSEIDYSTVGANTLMLEVSRRDQRSAFRAVLRPRGDRHVSADATIEEWLTDRRYSFQPSDGRIYRLEVRHAPWEIETCDVDIQSNDLLRQIFPGGSAGPALAHFVRENRVFIPRPLTLKSV
jgi:uncharacterized protein YqjF (DUF2071 family)